jgi:hypothetical protein
VNAPAVDPANVRRFFATQAPDRKRDAAIAAGDWQVVAEYVRPFTDPERVRAAHIRRNATLLLAALEASP